MIQSLVSAFYQIPSAVDSTFFFFQFMKCVWYLGLFHVDPLTLALLKNIIFLISVGFMESFSIDQCVVVVVVVVYFNHLQNSGQISFSFGQKSSLPDLQFCGAICNSLFQTRDQSSAALFPIQTLVVPYCLKPNLSSAFQPFSHL